MFQLRSAEVEYEHQPLFGSGNDLGGVTLNPRGSHSAWTAFSVPEGMTQARLVVYHDAFFQQTISISFEHNPELPIGMGE